MSIDSGHPSDLCVGNRGFALLLSLLALVVLGGLISCALLIGLHYQALGRNAIRAEQAFRAAEGGANAAIAQWSTTSTGWAVGESASTAKTWLADSSGWYRVTVTRLSDQMLLLVSEGASVDASSRHGVGALLRVKGVLSDGAPSLGVEPRVARLDGRWWLDLD